MEKLNKKILAFALVVAFAILMPIGNVQASLQANQNTQYTRKYSIENWMQFFRQMETTGEAMGLTETLNTDLTQSSNSNGIDVHMMRSTEYGAIAILSASGYGNSSNNNNITSTTGNKTGVMLETSYHEYVAGGVKGRIFTDVNSRYFDTYTTDTNSARVGDALGTSTTTNPGCRQWHTTAETRWIADNYPYFVRGNGGIFAFYNNAAAATTYSRGVAVCGEGL